MTRFSWPLHGPLVALLPILPLYLGNLADDPGWVRPVLVSMAVWAVFAVLQRFFAGGWLKATVLATLVFGFLVYVPGLIALLMRTGLPPAAVALAGIVGSLVGYTYLVRGIRAAGDDRLRSVNALLTWMAVGAVSVLLVPVVRHGWQIESRKKSIETAIPDLVAVVAPGTPRPTESTALTNRDIRPDVYYVVLDGYGRSDVLADRFGYVNDAFERALEDRGFLVASESCANYCQTRLSLASSMNLNYLDAMAGRLGSHANDNWVFRELIVDSLVFRTVRAHGYETISVRTGYWPTETNDGNAVHLSPAGIPTWFESYLLETTLPGRVVSAVTGVDGYTGHARTVDFAFDTLHTVGRRPGPKFVFVHVICPHPPFLFDAAGNVSRQPGPFRMSDGQPDYEPELYRHAYPEQLEFVNARVLSAIDAILAASDTPPVILLQGDHGPGMRYDHDDMDGTDLLQRFAILNAYHLPGDARDRLHPAISPVNSFRIVLNEWFGTDLPLLPDRSHFSTTSRPWAFVDVTEEVAPPVTSD